MEKVDLVFLEQVQNAVVVLPNDRILSLDHLWQVQAQAFDVDPVVREVVAGVVKMFRRL